MYVHLKSTIKDKKLLQAVKPAMHAVDNVICNVFGHEPEFVIAGTGRCGTVFIADAIDKMDVPCRHEYFYGPDGFHKRIGVKGDVSWLAVPYLDGYKGRVIHVVRDPVKVINALVSARAFDTARLDNKYVGFVAKHFDLSGDQTLDAMRYYIEWNRRIEKHGTMRFRLEDIKNDFPKVMGAIGKPCPDNYREILEGMPRLNSRSKQMVDVSDYPKGDVLEQLRSIAEEYGYDLTKENNNA